MKEKLAGINSIMEALKGRRRVKKIYVQQGRQDKRMEEILKLAQKKAVYVHYVERQTLDQFYTLGNHQGVVAEVETYPYSDLNQVLQHTLAKTDEPFFLILDGMEDPQNLGSIIRTAECAGVHGIILPRHNAAEISGSVARASAGAVEHMHIIKETNLVNTIKYLKEQGFWVIGADMQGNQEYFSTSIPCPTALVIGGEGQGIRRLVKENCDMLVRIPMQGNINSLNASVSAALLIYEVVRQRRQGK